MKTVQQKKSDFLQELRQLCFKYRCELSLSDDGKPYGMHSPIMVLSFEGVYSDSGDVIEEYGEFELDNIYIPAAETARP
jgi:hypothetical protein